MALYWPAPNLGPSLFLWCGGQQFIAGRWCGAPSEQSAIGEEEDSEEDEESQKFGDLSCPSVEPFYFAPPPSESFSKRGREVSRHDAAFMRGKPRLMALWEGESHLVFGIGGHLRTVIDWYEG